MPTEADEDWITAVSTAPARIPSSGLEKDTISRANQASSSRNFMAELISCIPVIRARNPSSTWPTPCLPGFLQNIYSTMPTVPSSGARVEGLHS